MNDLLIVFVVHWYLSLFSQTFFMHRFGAHAMFSMSPGWVKFFYLFSWITMGSSYLSPYAYSILHRLHHAFADTPNDPHSPTYTKGLFPLMWKTKKVYQDIESGKSKVDEKFTKNVPEWKAFDAFAGNMWVRILFGVGYFFIYLSLATSWWMWLLFPLTCLMGPVHGAIINYFAHKYGYRNFDDTNDTSRNFLPVDVLMLGESYHNNHHKHKARPNFGVRWFEVDPVYPLIKLLHWTGVIRLKKA